MAEPRDEELIRRLYHAASMTNQAGLDGMLLEQAGDRLRMLLDGEIRVHQDDDHECVFVEEQEPSGRLILGPCLGCNRPALEALEELSMSKGGSASDV